MAGAAERGAIGAVIGAAWGALNGATLTSRVIQAAYFATLGFVTGSTLGRTRPTLLSLSRRDRKTARRCARRGVAPDDARLAPGVLETAAFFMAPVPFERVLAGLFAAWVVVLAVVAALCGAAGEVGNAVGAGIGAAFAALMAGGLEYQRRTLQPRARSSFDATTVLMHQRAS